jgi:hypothetical protein
MKNSSKLNRFNESNNNNFVYELLNYDSDKHYSLKAISTVEATRISNSDLIELNIRLTTLAYANKPLLFIIKFVQIIINTSKRIDQMMLLNTFKVN